jgi:uncharacterized protein (DUF736 family)
VKFVAAEGDNEKGPDFRVIAAGTEFGAAWKKTSDKGNDYLSVKLDDRRSRLQSMRAWWRAKARIWRSSGRAVAPPTGPATSEAPRKRGFVMLISATAR